MTQNVCVWHRHMHLMPLEDVCAKGRNVHQHQNIELPGPGVVACDGQKVPGFCSGLGCDRGAISSHWWSKEVTL